MTTCARCGGPLDLDAETLRLWIRGGYETPPPILYRCMLCGRDYRLNPEAVSARADLIELYRPCTVPGCHTLAWAPGRRHCLEHRSTIVRPCQWPQCQAQSRGPRAHYCEEHAREADLRRRRLIAMHHRARRVQRASQGASR
jgi:DNA-directed RNA polymerase subunit RPC12/RpoP